VTAYTQTTLFFTAGSTSLAERQRQEALVATLFRAACV
jgi:hypothetical protein